MGWLLVVVAGFWHARNQAYFAGATSNPLSPPWYVTGTTVNGHPQLSLDTRPTFSAASWKVISLLLGAPLVVRPMGE
jgi:hypothetical protein